jgi:hypothetical protein
VQYQSFGAGGYVIVKAGEESQAVSENLGDVPIINTTKDPNVSGDAPGRSMSKKLVLGLEDAEVAYTEPSLYTVQLVTVMLLADQTILPP